MLDQELEFLAEAGVITQQQLTRMLSDLPTEKSLTSNAHPDSNGLAAVRLNVTSPNRTGYYGQKQNNAFVEPVSTNIPPPAYGTPAPPPPPAAATPQILTHAVSLYAYNATDVGDLNLQAEDRIAVTEYMNAEWWKGRNERSGQEGIFPRSYVRVEEKSLAVSGPSNYGNVPLDVAHGSQQSDDPKKPSMGKKIGGKLGNAAIFGAGGKFSSIDVHLPTAILIVRNNSYHRKQFGQLHILRHQQDAGVAFIRRVFCNWTYIVFVRIMIKSNFTFNAIIMHPSISATDRYSSHTSYFPILSLMVTKALSRSHVPT